MFLANIVVRAQLKEFNIPNRSQFFPTKNDKSARMNEVIVPLQLPFWDDFSNPILGADKVPNLDSKLWASANTVTLNNGLCINPPSKNVVTFDGRNENGKPYSLNDVLAKGWADSLVSQPIRLDLVEPDMRNSTYLSFFYQVGGLSEKPDKEDHLCVFFKNKDKSWEIVERIVNDLTLSSDTFYQILIPINYDRFFHENFQFKIQNWARLSGPYDNWHVDYIFLNKGRSADDTSFPDRTVSSQIGSIFKDYYSIPARHFLKDASDNLQEPILTLYNLRKNNPQPFNYTTTAILTQKVSGQLLTKEVTLEKPLITDQGRILTGLQFLNVNLKTAPLASEFDVNADSIGIEIKYFMATKDNILIENQGDYDPSKYDPINFRVNDSTKSVNVLSSYYAYDDGTAESSAGIDQSGALLAYKFNLINYLSDTLVSVDIYFPSYDNNSSQSIELQIRKDLSDDASSIIYNKSNLAVRTSAENVFTSYPIDPKVIVGSEFFIVIKLSNNVFIPIGLDKNTDNADKLYSSTNGQWIQNTKVIGSLMVRPHFGGGVISGISPENKTAIYPNPTSNRCFLPICSERIYVHDMMGRKIDFSIEINNDLKVLEFTNPVDGVVLVSYNCDGQNINEKVMVLKVR